MTNATESTPVFTDIDLKNMKEGIEVCDCPDAPTTQLKALLTRLEAAEVVAKECAHDDDCIRNRNEAGEPVEGGGYRMKYAGKWYQSSPVDETPKCNCGLDEKWNAWRKAAGK